MSSLDTERSAGLPNQEKTQRSRESAAEFPIVRSARRHRGQSRKHREVLERAGGPRREM